MTGALDTGVYQVQYQPNGTFVFLNGPIIPYVTPGNGSITDSFGTVWTITVGGQVAINGAADALTSNVTFGLLMGAPQQFWQLTNAGNWSLTNVPWVSGNWTLIGTTSPLRSPGVAISNLTLSTTYNLRIYATNTNGLGVPSSVITVTTASS